MHHHEADVHICRFATVKGHPLLQFPCSIDMLDDFFCVRLGNEGECPTNNDEDDEDMDDIGTVNSLVSYSHLTESLLSFSLSSSMSAAHLLQNQHLSLHHLWKSSALRNS